MVTLQNLITRAKEVCDERQAGKNTATRVGSLFYDMILFLNGRDGADGKDGSDGADGRGIAHSTMDENGNLIITYTDETADNVGNVVGIPGRDGADGKDGKDGINGTDGTPGQDGKDGRDGTNGRNGADGQNGVDGNDGKDGRDGQDGTGGTAPIAPNYAGHITAKVTGASITGAWTANSPGVVVYRQFSFNSATIQTETSPLTVIPTGGDENLIASGRLRENNRTGQVHLWEITVDYTNVGNGAQFILIGRLRNPDSGFEATDQHHLYTINSNVSGKLIFKFQTIADENSLGTGRGYIFEIGSIHNSWNAPAVLSVSKIQRVSLAMENGVDDYVEINGVKWAKTNVDAPGTFAANSESHGMLYQWNRRIGWSNTGQLVNSDGGNAWNGSVPAGNTWENSNDPSPAGWRVPTNVELSTLLDANNVLNEIVSHNGVQCRRFTDISTGAYIVMPFSRFRNNADGGMSAGTGVYIWSNTEQSPTNAHYLSVPPTGTSSIANINKGYGFTIRSVKMN